MKECDFTIISNDRIAKGTFRMVLEGDTSGIAGSGQFVQVELPGKFLRRPISVSSFCDGNLVLIYKVVGHGTELMSNMESGEGLSVLTGLGNCFDIDACRSAALLLGGGVGTAPLFELAKELICQGKNVTVVLGFNSSDEVFLKEDFERLGATVYVATMDGSCGVKGFVTDALRQYAPEYDCFYACGPLPMLRAVCSSLEGNGQASMEERMGCGFGICYGCTIQTVKGPRRVCADGPVFNKEDLLWQ